MPRTKKNPDAENEIVPEVEVAEGVPQKKKRGRPAKKNDEVQENAPAKDAAPAEAPVKEAPKPEPVNNAAAAPAADAAPAKEAPKDAPKGEQGDKPQNRENNGQNNGQNNSQNNGQNNGGNNQNNQNGQNGQNNQNNQNNQNGQNNRFNNNKFNKFNKFKNRHNRNLPQDDFLDETIQLPPPDPEKVAAAKAKWKELRGLPMFELQRQAEELGIAEFKKMRKQALVYSILSAITGEDCPIYTEGVLEIIPDGGHGFLRNPEHNYLAGPDDIYALSTACQNYYGCSPQ